MIALRLLLVSWALLLAQPCLGFDTTRHSIAPEDIISGGPPKDGIPALLEPRFLAASAATFLKPDDVVIGRASGSVAKAYPLRILNWHEVVNDDIGGQPIVVTYCPLTASGVVYDRVVAERTLTFGVSGLLFQSNVLFYDHQTESLWSQIKEEAVTGSFTGTQLRALPSVTTTWADWRAAHPDTLVLSPETGYQRDYNRDPYVAYRASADIMFPVTHADHRLPPKERIFGLRVGAATKAYPLVALAKTPQLKDEIGGQRLRIDYDPTPGRVSAVVIDTNKPWPGVVVYWFAWSAFHPDTRVLGDPAGPAGAPSPAPLYGAAVGTSTVAIRDHRAYWTELLGPGASGDSGLSRTPSVFVIRGEIRNESAVPLHHVQLVFELLDATGGVVATEVGYNRGAEAVRAVDSPVPFKIADPPLVPIPPGGTDTFRMLFLRNETPEFAAYRVRMLEAVSTGPADRSGGDGAN